MAPESRYHLTAAQAAARLGVTRATLYAYTSRGLLRSEPMPGRTRARHYYREDIERLRDKKEMRRDPVNAAARGLHWGGPVRDSGITLIHGGMLYYRGQNAVQLAQTASLEAVAAILWAAAAGERPRLFEQPAAMSLRQLAPLRAVARDPLAVMQAALPIAAALDAAAYDLRPTAVRQTGARIVRLFARIVTRRDSTAPLHEALQAAWGSSGIAVGDAIRVALVLCADHELNVSAFAARCAASAGASPYDVVSAALATFKGYKHGGAAERVLALLDEIDTPNRARAVMAGRLRRGEAVPGFGHPLYPGGDPRAVLLLRLAETSGDAAEWRRVRGVWRAGATLLQDFPNLDFGLAALARTHRLPARAPALLFALGRTIGWLAHAFEEYASGQLIRPRARYTGPPPATDLAEKGSDPAWQRHLTAGGRTRSEKPRTTGPNPEPRRR
jgi:citrate synthase